MTHLRLDRRTMLVGTLGALASAAQAQTGSTLTFLVPQPAGNATDGMARKAAPILQKALGQNVIVENVPGAGGSIGLAKTLSASYGDGQVLTIGSQSEFILTSLSMAGARYRPEDFRCVAVTGIAPYMLVSRPDFPANNFAEAMALGRQANAKPLTFGHIGNGSLIHLIGEHMKRRMKLSLIDVAYKGTPLIVQDLMGGQIDLSFLPIAGSTISLVESGKVKAFGTTSTAPVPAIAKVPQIPKIEPLLQELVYAAWGGVCVPAKTSEPAVQRLHKAFIEVLNDPEAKAWVASTGVRMEEPRTLAQLDQFYRSETRQYQGLAKEIGITPQ